MENLSLKPDSSGVLPNTMLANPGAYAKLQESKKTRRLLLASAFCHMTADECYAIIEYLQGRSAVDVAAELEDVNMGTAALVHANLQSRFADEAGTLEAVSNHITANVKYLDVGYPAPVAMMVPTRNALEKLFPSIASAFDSATDALKSIVTKKGFEGAPVSCLERSSQGELTRKNMATAYETIVTPDEKIGKGVLAVAAAAATGVVAGIPLIGKPLSNGLSAIGDAIFGSGEDKSASGGGGL